jgi:hypothetical protein
MTINQRFTYSGDDAVEVVSEDQLAAMGINPIVASPAEPTADLATAKGDKARSLVERAKAMKSGKTT